MLPRFFSAATGSSGWVYILKICSMIPGRMLSMKGTQKPVMHCLQSLDAYFCIITTNLCMHTTPPHHTLCRISTQCISNSCTLGKVSEQVWIGQCVRTQADTSRSSVAVWSWSFTSSVGSWPLDSAAAIAFLAFISCRVIFTRSVKRTYDQNATRELYG